jgi:hypothetical protein
MMGLPTGELCLLYFKLVLLVARALVGKSAFAACFRDLRHGSLLMSETSWHASMAGEAT